MTQFALDKEFMKWVTVEEDPVFQFRLKPDAPAHIKSQFIMLEEYYRKEFFTGGEEE